MKNSTKKMKTISQQILNPFIVIIITLPMVILLTFNISMSFYAENSAKRELRNTQATLTSLLSAQGEQAPPKEDAEPGSNIDNIVTTLTTALTAARLTGNTQFFMLDKNSRIIYPKDISSSIINEDLQESILKSPIVADQSIESRHQGGSTFYLTASKLAHYHNMDDITLLFVSNGSTAKDFIQLVNFILFIVTSITLVIALLISSRLAHKISKPISVASEYAKKIGDGEFLTMPAYEDTVEINQFCLSINDMSQRLEAYDTAQKQFLQNASHELRTPLMSIQGYAEGIENGVLENYQEAAAVIRKESIRLNTLVNELLTLSRIENQTYQQSLFEHDLSNLLMDCVQRINGLAMKENIKIRTVLTPGITAKVDEALFSQVIINIISNCIRYANSIITVTAQLEDEKALIVISDDGPGFSEEELPHIFERFYKGKSGNFGLGLAISRSAIEYMNGTIESYNGKPGAIFEIRI